jgi:hypothetical protein
MDRLVEYLRKSFLINRFVAVNSLLLRNSDVIGRQVDRGSIITFHSVGLDVFVQIAFVHVALTDNDPEVLPSLRIVSKSFRITRIGLTYRTAANGQRGHKQDAWKEAPPVHYHNHKLSHG